MQSIERNHEIKHFLNGRRRASAISNRRLGTVAGPKWLWAKLIMSRDGSTPTTEPFEAREAICAVIFPSPQPTSRIRSEPLRSSRASTSCAIASCSDERREYSAASHSVMFGDQEFHNLSRLSRRFQ